MQTRFLHLADVHLGFRQYNHTERYNDFARAYLAVVEAAIEAKVDFVILAGDLFEKRSIDALTLNQAMRGLEMLATAGIPVIAVEGNHERAYYDEQVGWLRFLALRDLLVLLHPTFKEGKPQLTAYARRHGAYIDPVPGVRVYGMGWMGSATATNLEAYADALAEQPHDGIEYTIFISHAGVEGVLDGASGGLSMRQWSVLKPRVDYLALGHIHKPYTFDDWVYNPGSPETCSVAEVEWPERGYLLVDVDTARADDEPRHIAQLHANPRRRFLRLRLQVDHLKTPDALMEECRAFLEREARKQKLGQLGDRERPVVELQLAGVLPFDRKALDITAIEALVTECCNPLLPLVKNVTRAVEFGIDTDDRAGRRELEAGVIDDLLSRDARYRAQSAQWTQVALALKHLALDGAGSEAIIDELAARMAALESASASSPANVAPTEE